MDILDILMHIYAILCAACLASMILYCYKRFCRAKETYQDDTESAVYYFDDFSTKSPEKLHVPVVYYYWDEWFSRNEPAQGPETYV